jgi:hypothetical protein
MMTNCTLTEILTAHGRRSLDRFDAGCLIRDVFILGHTSKSRFSENIFACLHFEQTSVLASLLKVIWLHFERVWSRICI